MFTKSFVPSCYSQCYCYYQCEDAKNVLNCFNDDFDDDDDGGDDDDDNDDALTVLEGSYFNVPPPTPAYLDKSMDNHSYHSDFCVTARSNAPLPVRYQIATKVPPLPLNAYPLKGILKNS